MSRPDFDADLKLIREFVASRPLGSDWTTKAKRAFELSDRFRSAVAADLETPQEWRCYLLTEDGIVVAALAPLNVRDIVRIHHVDDELERAPESIKESLWAVLLRGAEVVTYMQITPMGVGLVLTTYADRNRWDYGDQGLEFHNPDALDDWIEFDKGHAQRPPFSRS